MANRFEPLKTEVSTTSQAYLTWETGESGPRFLKSHQLFRESSYGRGIQRRLPFIQDIILKNCRHTPVSSKSVSDAIYSENWPHFRMKRRYIAGNLLLILFSESGNTVKNSDDAPGEKKNGSRYLSPKDRKYSEKSEPNSVRLRV